MSRILAVDDNLEILLVVRAALEEAGHQVMTTSTPQEALALVEANPLDAVISDIMMPGISGLELLGLLRALPGREALPVLFLSALSDTDSRVKGLRLGADDYLGKPFEPAELVARIERLVDRRRPVATGLSGDVASFSLGGLLQSLAEHRSSGVLEVSGGPTTGTILLRHGQMAEARCRELTGVNAALTLMAAPSGRFQFTASEPPSQPGVPLPTIAWQALLLEAAWTEDELTRRRRFLPATTTPLQALATVPPPIPDEFHHIPIAEVLQTLVSGRARALGELLDLDLATPARVELAVAWLVEQRWLEGATELSQHSEAPVEETAAEDSAAEDAFRAFVQGTLARGLSLDDLTMLICYDDSAWPRLRSLLESAPSSWIEDPVTFEILLATGRGSVPIHHRAGDLLIHVQPYPRAEVSSFLSDLESQAAVVLWLGDESRHLSPQALVQAVQQLPEACPGILVATSTQTKRLAHSLSVQAPRWQIAPAVPLSLAELLAVCR